MLGSKAKMKFDFSESIFDDSLSKNLILEEFLICIGCISWYWPKSNSGLEKVSGVKIYAYCFHGDFPRITLFGSTKFQYQTFLLLKILKYLCFYKSQFGHIIISLNLGFMTQQWPIGEKKEKREVEKFEYLQNKKSFFR